MDLHFFALLPNISHNNVYIREKKSEEIGIETIDREIVSEKKTQDAIMRTLNAD